MKFPKRNPMYFVFIAVQTFAIILIIIGSNTKGLARDPDACDEKAGLLMVQIGCTIEVGIKLFVLILFLLFNRFGQPPESYGKPVFSFIAWIILWIVAIVMVSVGSAMFKKFSFYLAVQGLSFLNEGAFNLYHIRIYKQV